MSQPISATSHRRKGPSRDLRKEDFWRKTLREHAGSGQGVRTFCRAHGLSEPLFYAWRRTIAQRDRKAAPPSVRRTTLRPTFVELRPPPVVPSAPTDALLEIMAGNLRLRIASGCDRALLRDVLAMLEERHSPSRPTAEEA